MISNKLIQIYIDLLTTIGTEVVLGFSIKWNDCYQPQIGANPNEFITDYPVVVINALDNSNEMITFQVSAKRSLTCLYSKKLSFNYFSHFKQWLHINVFYRLLRILITSMSALPSMVGLFCLHVWDNLLITH